MYELPYGNTQQLNLDWFIKRWKEFYEEWEQTKTEIDGALDEEVQKVEDAMEDLYAARDAAAASATAAAASATSASNDATIAANAATAAAASATLANTKATAAGLSEAAAALSASQAANDATAAATSASQASASASSATDSAQAAATSEQNIESIIEDAIQDATDAAVAEATADAEAAATAAESCASDAADSATAAAASATAADSSADDAADSATAAAGSATAAAGSASDAADSATAAAASAASIVVDSAMSDSSTNPVQNKVINGELTQLKTALIQRTLYETTAVSDVFSAFKGWAVNSVGRYSSTANSVMTNTGEGTTYLFKDSSFYANIGYKLNYAFWKIPVYSNSGLTNRISFKQNVAAGTTVIVPEDCYVLISVMKSDESAFDASLTAMQILQAAITIDVYYREIKEYVDEVPKLSEFATESITPINTVSSGLIWPDNIVNTANYTANKKIKDSTGEIVDYDSYYLSDYFAIKPSTKYTALGSATALNIYDYSKNLVATFYPSSQSIGTITTPANAAFARMSSNANVNTWQINEGETLKTYTPYTPIKISDEIIEPKKSNYYHGELLATPADVSNRYFGLLSSYSTQVSLNRDTTYAEIIGMFDDLVTEANGYITKTDLGAVSGLISGSAPHVYKYTFKPKQISVSGSTETPVKILIDAAMHGFEKNSAYAWYFFLCDLVRNYKDNPSLALIRSNVEIQIIPVLLLL